MAIHYRIYNKQNFVDRAVDENGDVVQEGTILKSEHLNHIEEGIKNLETKALDIGSEVSSVVETVVVHPDGYTSSNSYEKKQVRHSAIPESVLDEDDLDKKTIKWKHIGENPFNVSLAGSATVKGDTLFWDCNTSAMPVHSGGSKYSNFYYASDNVPTMDDLSKGYSIYYNNGYGGEIKISIAPTETDNYIYFGDLDGQYIFIVKKPWVNGNREYKYPGVYLFGTESGTGTCRFQINDYEWTECTAIVPIDDKYLPNNLLRDTDETLSVPGMAADAKAVGDAIKPIAALTETTTTNAITWDGVVGDKVTGEIRVGEIVAISLVRVSDYVPDVSVFTEQGIIIGGTFEGNTEEFPIDAEEVENSILHAENCYTMELFAVALEDNVVAHIQTDVYSTITLPKKGVYFIQDTEVTSMRSLSSPLLAVPVTKVKPEALPDSVKKQPDWNQHDSTAPDYVKNRVAYPAYSPVLLCETSDGTSGDACVYGMDGLKAYPAPAEGKQYTFGIAGGKVYTGVASSGEYDDDGEMLPGIMIADENNNALVFYINLYGMSGWYAKIPDFDFDNVNYTELALVVVEGDNACNKLSVPDDVLLSGEDMNIVFEFKSMREYPPDYIRALLNDVEVVVDENGVETVYAKDDLLILGEADYITNGVMYALGEKTIAMIAPMGESSETMVLTLVDEQAATGSGTTVKSFKVNIPGIFAPNVPAKKLPVECLPDDAGGKTYYVNAINLDDVRLYNDLECTVMVTKDEFSAAVARAPISAALVIDGVIRVRVLPIMCTAANDYGFVVVAPNTSSEGIPNFKYYYTAEYPG